MCFCDDEIHRSGPARRDRRLRPIRLGAAVDELPRAHSHEYSSGEQRHRGYITKAGNQRARWLVVRPAWHYRRPPAAEARVVAAERRPRRPVARAPAAWAGLHHRHRR